MQATKPRILFVEDHEDTRELIRLVFQQATYELVTATTVSSALTLARAERFNLFILDCRLPDGSGFELCREIRRMDRLTPILFYSALAFEKDRDEALQAGAQKYLVKPVSISVLLSAVAELVEVSRKAPVRRRINATKSQAAA
jgi:DNA-binding response OmpR family regulator